MACYFYYSPAFPKINFLQLKGSISDDELKNLHEQKKCEAVEEFKKDIEATVCGSPAYWIENLEQVIEVVLLHVTL